MGRARWRTMSLVGMASLAVFGAPAPASAAPSPPLRSTALGREISNRPAPAATADNLYLRANASTLVRPPGLLNKGTGILVSCQVAGESTTRTARSSTWWDRLTTGRFVSDTFVRWPFGRPDVPWCSFAGPRIPTSGEPFVQWAARFAVQTKVSHQVPAAVTIAQAILESGWGRSALTRDGNSFFGMKCFGSPGSQATGCRSFRTQECDSDSCFSTKASFRLYDTVEASFVDHADELASLPRYRPAFAYVNDPNRFAVAIARAGYATTPTYAQDLIDLMREFDLYRFDRD